MGISRVFILHVVNINLQTVTIGKEQGDVVCHKEAETKKKPLFNLLVATKGGIKAT